MTGVYWRDSQTCKNVRGSIGYLRVMRDRDSLARYDRLVSEWLRQLDDRQLHEDRRRTRRKHILRSREYFERRGIEYEGEEWPRPKTLVV